MYLKLFERRSKFSLLQLPVSRVLIKRNIILSHRIYYNEPRRFFDRRDYHALCNYHPDTNNSDNNNNNDNNNKMKSDNVESITVQGTRIAIPPQFVNARKLWKKILSSDIKFVKTDTGIEIYSLDDTFWMGVGRADVDRHLFVRSDCKKIFKEIISEMQTNTGGAINGNPGIGKTFFLNYILMKLGVEKKNTFVYESAVNGLCYKFQPDGVVEFCVGRPHIWLSDLSCSSTIYLFDPDSTPISPLEVPAFTIVSTSPIFPYMNILHSYLNRIGIFLIFVPCWKFEEANSIREYFPAITDFDFNSRFNLYGGILRYLFGSKAQQLNFYNKRHWALERVKVLTKDQINLYMFEGITTEEKAMMLQFRFQQNEYKTPFVDAATTQIGAIMNKSTFIYPV